MNILQVTPRLPAPPADGGAVYIYFLTKYMAKRGHNIIMASLLSNKHKQDPDAIQKFATLYSKPGNFKPYNITALLKSVITRKPITIQHRMKPGLMKPLLNKIDDKIDVILLEGLHVANFIREIRLFFPNTPIVLRQSNAEHQIFNSYAKTTNNPVYKLLYRDQARLMKYYEQWAILQVDAVSVISKRDKRKLKDLAPDQDFFISPAGAELPEIKYTRDFDKTIIAISNWKWKPNIDGLRWYFEQVHPAITKRFPEVTLKIIGDGLPKEMIGKFENTEYLGFVENITYYRQKAALSVIPLFSGSGMKLKVVEGLANGLPIITTDEGAKGIKMEDQKHYLRANNKLEFIEAISILIKDQTLKEKLSKNARKLIKNRYEWSVIVRRYEDFLKNRLL